MNDYILIEYSNSVDFGDIVYHNGFENKVYLNADVSKPEYELIEEGVENGDNEFSPTYQKWSKKYLIEFYAQEFLVDALTLMALHDQVTVTLKNGESSLVKDVEVSPEWDAKIECWAKVTIKFATNYLVRKGCDENFAYGCLEEVVETSSGYGTPYDADDGGAGQAMWEQTGSLAPNGTIAFFYTEIPIGDSGYTGSPLGFYRFNGVTKVWDLIDMENGQLGATGLTDCLFLTKNGNSYFKMPYIRSLTDDGGGDATIYASAYGFENNFYQVQVNDGGWADIGDPQLASVFENGFTVSPGVGNFDFRIKWYTHGCEYGTGNEVNEDIT